MRSAARKRHGDRRHILRSANQEMSKKRIGLPIWCRPCRHILRLAVHRTGCGPCHGNRMGRQMRRQPVWTKPSPVAAGRWSPRYGMTWSKGSTTTFPRYEVHSGAVAEQSAQDVNAQAYTMGHDIVFGASRYAPGTHEGQRLLAHELTHVVQQSRSGVSALQMKRGGGSERGKPKEKTILVIHAQAGSKVGASAVISGEAEPISIELTFNVLTEGDYTLVKRDIPETVLVEYENEDGSPAGIAWRRPKGIHAAERVRVKVQAQEFDFAQFAQAEFDAVDPHLKERLSKRGGQRLTTPEAKLGFSYFAKELKARGVTDEELILYQSHHRGGVNPRDRFDWANNWKDAVDEVLGARGKLEKAAAENTANFAAVGGAFTGLSDEAYKAYRVSRLLPGYEEAAEEQFKEAGTSLTEFGANRDVLLEMFDQRLRLETFAVLAKFEGGLLLTKERLVDNKEGRRQIDLARQAADRDDVKLLKSQSEDAARDRDAAERAWLAASRSSTSHHPISTS